jgi:hypothetical protein
MSFNKKDYQYERLVLNDDSNLSNDSLKKKLKSLNPNESLVIDEGNSRNAEAVADRGKRYKYPSQRSIDIFTDLQQFASSQGLPFLDKCNAVDFAIFASRYTPDAWENY